MLGRFPLVVLSLVLAASAAAGPAVAPGAGGPAPTQVFVLAGQSNMLGRGVPLTQGEHSNSRLLVWRSGGWRVAADPLGDPADRSNGVGPGMSFGLKVLQDDPSAVVGLVMCAKSGSPIGDWLPPSQLYRGCIAAARSTHGPITGLAFLQGESDARYEHESQSWADTFGLALKAFRTDLGRSLPVVLIQIGKIDQRAYPFQKNVRSQQVLAAARAGIPIVSTLDLAIQPDGGHFTIPSYKTIGARAASAWWTATHP